MSSCNPIFAAAIDVLQKRPAAVIAAMDDFVRPQDRFEVAAKKIYTENMGLLELIEYLRAEFGGNYQTMLENIQAVR